MSSRAKCLIFGLTSVTSIIELLCDKSNDLGFSPSNDLDQPGHPPILIQIFCWFCHAEVCLFGKQKPGTVASMCRLVLDS